MVRGVFLVFAGNAALAARGVDARVVDALIGGLKNRSDVCSDIIEDDIGDDNREEVSSLLYSS